MIYIRGYGIEPKFNQGLTADLAKTPFRQKVEQNIAAIKITQENNGKDSGKKAAIIIGGIATVGVAIGAVAYLKGRKIIQGLANQASDGKYKATFFKKVSLGFSSMLNSLKDNNVVQSLRNKVKKIKFAKK